MLSVLKQINIKERLRNKIFQLKEKIMRYDKMSAFIVMDIVREAAKYPNAIHFEIGQPDLPPSENIKTALKNYFKIYHLLNKHIE